MLLSQVKAAEVLNATNPVEESDGLSDTSDIFIRALGLGTYHGCWMSLRYQPSTFVPSGTCWIRTFLGAY
jgi:hypothetical protein